MIQANELRIGNLVEYRRGYYIREAYHVQSKKIKIENISDEGINIQWYYDGSYPESEFKHLVGIELTPEILEQCGFTYEKNITEWANGPQDLSYHYIQLPSGKRIEIFEDYSCGYYKGEDQELKYLHQLQNLYFALTGKELEIKELVK